MDTRFTSSDGWLMVTLWAAKGPCDRRKLNGVGDAVNHAVFNDDEVIEGMNRLSASGYAETLTDGSMTLTHAGRSLVELHRKPELGISGLIRDVTAALQN